MVSNIKHIHLVALCKGVTMLKKLLGNSVDEDTAVWYPAVCRGHVRNESKGKGGLFKKLPRGRRLSTRLESGPVSVLRN